MCVGSYRSTLLQMSSTHSSMVATDNQQMCGSISSWLLARPGLHQKETADTFTIGHQ